MALPKLNNVPKYQILVPSLNKKVSVRPFLVKEEKVMLIALESQDPQQIAMAMLDAVTACILDEVDTKKLTGYDIEYLFLQIRAKSVGETTKVLLKCDKCEDQHETEVTIDLSKIEMKGQTDSNEVKITDNIVLEMQHPTFMSMMKNEKAIGFDKTEQAFALIKESVMSVMTDEERIDMNETSHEEFQEFLESMTQEQFGKVREYVEKIPKLTYDVNYECGKCKKKNTVVLEGLQSFL
tara:strand:+ start:921 stop:1634 length:714 start_codon:yes stop_codon:yes gene_type:complete